MLVVCYNHLGGHTARIRAHESSSRLPCLEKVTQEAAQGGRILGFPFLNKLEQDVNIAETTTSRTSRNMGILWSISAYMVLIRFFPT